MVEDILTKGHKPKNPVWEKLEMKRSDESEKHRESREVEVDRTDSPTQVRL